MLDELREQMLNLYNFEFRSKHDVCYFKNFRNIFYFTKNTTEITSNEKEQINITTLPYVFAAFILLPIDKSINFSTFQLNNIFGTLEIEIPKGLNKNLLEIKKLYDSYQKNYMKSNVINGMPLELNTTLIWLPKRIKNLNIRDNYRSFKQLIKFKKIIRLIKSM